ncbi:MAG: hypothetical protein F6K19_33380 [Cyanothece sp. SIO1E1]|nr:hypothetical protein [Cyanothece sp. SIO1E1]
MFRFPITWIILLLLSLFGRTQAQHQHYYKSIHSDQVVFGAKNSETANFLDQSSDFFLYHADDEQGSTKVYPITYLVDADEFFTVTIGSVYHLNSDWAKRYLAEFLGESTWRKSINSKLLEIKRGRKQNEQELEKKLTDKPVI